MTNRYVYHLDQGDDFTSQLHVKVAHLHTITACCLSEAKPVSLRTLMNLMWPREHRPPMVIIVNRQRPLLDSSSSQTAEGHTAPLVLWPSSSCNCCYCSPAVLSLGSPSSPCSPHSSPCRPQCAQLNLPHSRSPEGNTMSSERDFTAFTSSRVVDWRSNDSSEAFLAS